MKSIYDEALKILINALTNTRADNDNEYIFHRKELIEILKAIKEAQEQHELAELYEELAHTRSLLLNETDLIKTQALKKREEIISNKIEELEK